MHMVMALAMDSSSSSASASASASASSSDPIRSHPHPNPHRTTQSLTGNNNIQTAASSELFICFSSSSTSSMKLPSSSSKSILSPARNRDGPSLSSSLSRRLRTNGSFKAGSPMFPATGKKRGFDNPEPSSPKVTCIGQVRVKTKKKHAKKLRTATAAARSIHRTPSNNPAGAGLGLQVSFRKLELSRSGHHSFPNPNPNPNPECLPHRNQRWVHFPGTICEALRTFGADWNCFSPCMSSKHDHHHRKGHGSSHGGRGDAAVGNGNGNGDGDGSSCGAVIARWLVAVHDGEGRDRTSEIELVVGGEEEIPMTESHEESRRSRRRHIFEGLEFNEEEICKERKEEEGNGRVSVCIPPKNALLLMRCRSDPVKMAALANRFCGSPVANVADHSHEKPVEEEEASMEAEVEADESINNVSRDQECGVTAEPQGTAEADSSPVGDADVEEVEDGEVDEEIQMEILEESDYNSKEEEVGEDDDDEDDDEGDEDRPEVATASSSTPNPEDDTCEEEETGIAQQDQDGVVDPDDEELGLNPLKLVTNVEEEDEAPLEPEETLGKSDEAVVEMAKGRESVERRDAKVLPDCLLLMMCEPKLSMEVSKETWICSTDFIRWLPERQRRLVNNDKAAAGGWSGSEHKKRDNNKRSGNALTAHQARIVQQPPRSSCSFPRQAQAAAKGEGESMAAMIEQRLQNAKAGEPLVLTRCKSEPMRTAATKLAPDAACFWKNRKLEPHRSSASNLNLNLMRVKTAVPEVGS